MKIIGYKGDWTRNALATMVVHATRYCRYFVFVVAKNRSDEAMKLVDDLARHLVTRRIVNAWPGTVKLGGETGETLHFEVNQATTKAVVGRILPAMFLPEPPVEDLSLLRADGRPYFITITHERDAFFKLEPEEIDVLASVVGAENLVVQGNDELPEERY